MDTTVYFIRHVQAEGNVNRTFQGSTDTEVSPAGKIQLKNLTDRFSGTNIDVIYSSPLKRAKQTAEAVSGERDIPIILDDRLREFCAGEWEGKSIETLHTDYPELSVLWTDRLWEFKVHGSEDMGDLTKRVSEALADILKKHEGQTIVITSHACALRMLINFALGNEIEKVGEVDWVKNASITKMRFSGETFCDTEYFNRIDHVDKSTFIL